MVSDELPFLTIGPTTNHRDVEIALGEVATAYNCLLENYNDLLTQYEQLSELVSSLSELSSQPPAQVDLPALVELKGDLPVARVTGAASASDARLSDARVPVAHAATHKDGGTDSLALADLQGDLPVARVTGMIDANLLDGQDSSYYRDAANLEGELADERLTSNIPRLNGPFSNKFTGVLTVQRNGQNFVLDTVTAVDARAEFRVAGVRRGRFAWSNTVFQFRPDGVPLILGGVGESVGLYGTPGVGRQPAIASPSADVGSLKTAMDEMRTVVANIGITF